MSDLPTFYQKARAETCKILGYNAKRLSPEQTMRLDCAVALRLALDDMQGKIIRGEAVDITKMLTASEALARLLPPTVLASPPPEHRKDPRETMLRIYLDMLERGELTDRKREPKLIEALQAENAELRAEVERLGGAVAPRSTLASRSNSRSTAIDVPTSDVIPPREIAALDPGPRPGPDDPPKPVTIEPEYEEVVVTEVVLGEPPAWKNFISPDGSIRSSPRGGGWWKMGDV